MASNDTHASEECPYYVFSTAEIWITSIVYIVIIITSFVGNCLIIWVIYYNSQMRTVSHYFIINMAIADLLITMFGMPVSAKERIQNTSDISYGGVRGDIFCKILEYTQDVSISCSILTLVAIATDRYCATLIPFKRLITLSRAKIIMVFIWLFSLVITIPLLIVVRVETYGNEHFCYENWTPFEEIGAKALEKSYTTILFVMLYALPLCIISFLYCAVVLKVWRRKIPGQPTVRGRQLQQRTKKNLLKMFMTVVLCFMVCWLPYHVIFFATFKCVPTINVWFFCRFMGHANSSITPWIYVFFSKDYRKGIWRIFSMCACIKPTPPLSFERSSVHLGATSGEYLTTDMVTLKAYTNKTITD